MRTYKKFGLIVLIVSALAGASATGRFQSQKAGTGPDEHQKLTDAMRRGGLREVAKIKGHYVVSKDPNWDWSAFDLESLTKSSVGIIVGVPNIGKAQLDSAGDSINTNYEVTVKDVIKGNIRIGDTLQVALPGGKVDFDDGTSAEVETADFERMSQGREYVLFLYANSDGGTVFLTTGGTQGLFEITDAGKIKAALPTNIAAKQTKDQNVEAFLKEIALYAKAKN